MHATLGRRDTSCVTQQINSTVQRVDGENHVIHRYGARYDWALRGASSAATGEASKGDHVNGEISHREASGHNAVHYRCLRERLLIPQRGEDTGVRGEHESGEVAVVAVRFSPHQS